MKIVASGGIMGKPLASKPGTTQWCGSGSPFNRLELDAVGTAK